MFANNLLARTAKNRVCTALGVKLVTSPAIIQIAQHAKYDSVFIDLEHSTLSLENASSLCTNALLAGLTPFVRVPYQCGDGFVQRVLDGGAMGVVFPHISNKWEATQAVQICKYPPIGRRSMTGQLPQFGLAPTPTGTIIEESNRRGSTAFVMIETREGLSNIEEIAAVPGADVLLIGSNDLSIELGVQGQFDEKVFQDALELVANAARKYGKIFGLAGLYHRKDILDRAINQLNARYLLGQLDASLLIAAASENSKSIRSIQQDVAVNGDS